MTQITAVIRRDKGEATKAELGRIGCQGYSAFPVLGRGQQRGLRIKEEQAGLAFLPKVLFDVIVEDERTAETIEAIIRANQTGACGDGRIFVMQTAHAYRVSAGEREATEATAEATA